MKLAGLVYAAISLAKQHQINPGRTILQKIVYFALPPAQRREVYIPYHYGPYSRVVQMVADGLCANRYVCYAEETSTYSVKKDIPLKAIDAEKNLLDRLQKLMEFLKKKELREIGEIAFLSKIVHFDANRPDGLEDREFPSFARQKSRLYDWQEVAGAHDQKILQNLHLVRELNHLLEDGDRGRAQAH